jgi:hypothetical protein
VGVGEGVGDGVGVGWTKMGSDDVGVGVGLLVATGSGAGELPNRLTMRSSTMIASPATMPMARTSRIGAALFWRGTAGRRTTPVRRLLGSDG